MAFNASAMDPRHSMLFLCEGDAETADSFSGSSRALVTTLREFGWRVRPADVLAKGAADLLSKVLTVHPVRAHWSARYHYGPMGHALRSARARQAVTAHPVGAPVLQIGATFDIGASEKRLFFYCDANAAQGARGGEYSTVTSLTGRELKAMIERERRAYHRAAGIFTISECLRQSFINDFGVPPERVVTVHAGSNLRRLPPDAPRQSSPTSTPPTILFIGRQFERKGGRTLLAAFAVVRRALPDARLIVAGGQPNIGELPGVSVIGYIDPDRQGPGSVEALYGSADLFCMPSHYEPFGIVLVEAMLHGVPCIGANCWAMPEIIDDEETGWLVPPGSVEALASRLISALSNRPRLRAMGEEARKRARARFSWRKTVARMVEYMEHAETCRVPMATTSTPSRRPAPLADAAKLGA